MQKHMWENHGGKLSGGAVPELKQCWTDLFWQSEAKAKIEADPSILHSKLDHARVSLEGVLRLSRTARLALNKSIDLYLGMESEDKMNRMVRPASATSTSTSTSSSAASVSAAAAPFAHSPPPPISALARVEDHAADER